MSDYLAGHVQEALAHAGETDVHVRVAAGRLVLTGNVATAVRRDRVAAIVTQLAEGLEVSNEVSVLALAAPEERETLGP